MSPGLAAALLASATLGGPEPADPATVDLPAAPHVARPIESDRIVIDGARTDWPASLDPLALEAQSRAAAWIAHDDAAHLIVAIQADQALENVDLFLDLTGDATLDRPVQLSFDGALQAAQTRHENAASVAFSEDRRQVEWRVDLRTLGLDAPGGLATIGFDIEARTDDGALIQLGDGVGKWENKRRLSRVWLTGESTRFGTLTGTTRWAEASDRSPPQRILAEGLDHRGYRFQTGTDNGRFALRLPNGGYRVTAIDSRTTSTHAAPIEVAVSSDRTTRSGPLITRAPEGDPAALATELITAENIHAIGLAYAAPGRTFTATRGMEADGDPAGETTLFRMASVSKPVAAMVVLKLADAGLWSLDAPLSDYVVPDEIAGDPRHLQVTSRMVLRHVSGLPNTGSSEPLAFMHDPGARQSYSGEAFYWMRDAIEAALGRSFQALAVDHLFAPAGMTHSTFIFPADGDAHYAGKLHGDFMFALPDDWHESKIVGGLLTTAPDLAGFERYMLDGAGLSRHLYEDMITPNASSMLDPEGGREQRFGLGWVVEREPYLVLSHGGSERGARTFMAIAPEQDRALSVATNASGGLPAIRTLFHRLWLDDQPHPAIEAEFERWERFDR